MMQMSNPMMAHQMPPQVKSERLAYLLLNVLSKAIEI